MNSSNERLSVISSVAGTMAKFNDSSREYQNAVLQIYYQGISSAELQPNDARNTEDQNPLYTELLDQLARSYGDEATYTRYMETKGKRKKGTSEYRLYAKASEKARRIIRRLAEMEISPPVYENLDHGEMVDFDNSFTVNESPMPKLDQLSMDIKKIELQLQIIKLHKSILEDGLAENPLVSSRQRQILVTELSNLLATLVQVDLR